MKLDESTQKFMEWTLYYRRVDRHQDFLKNEIKMLLLKGLHNKNKQHQNSTQIFNDAKRQYNKTFQCNKKNFLLGHTRACDVPIIYFCMLVYGDIPLCHYM